MAHSDAREGKWRGNWRMEWVASTLHTTSEHGISSITTADAHTSAVSSRLNWRSAADLNGLVRFAERRNLKSGFCACAITFQLASTYSNIRYCIHCQEMWPLRLPFSCQWAPTPHIDSTLPFIHRSNIHNRWHSDQATDWPVKGSNPIKGWRRSLPQNVQTGLLFHGYRGSFPGGTTASV